MATQQNSNLPATIETDKFGLLKPSNIEDAFRLAKAYAMSGILPDRYAGKPEAVLCGMQMALELGLKPITGLRQIAVVKGTPTVFGDLPLAMVMASGWMESIKEVYFDETGAEISMKNQNLAAKVFGAICIVKRKGDPEYRETYFTMAEAKDAGLYPQKPDAAWMKYPKIMLKYRARSQALKDKFPDALNGIAIGEYDFNVMSEGEIIDVPAQNVPQQAQASTGSLADKLRAKAANPVEDSNEPVIIAETPIEEVSND